MMPNSVRPSGFSEVQEAQLCTSELQGQERGYFGLCLLMGLHEPWLLDKKMSELIKVSKLLLPASCPLS